MLEVRPFADDDVIHLGSIHGPDRVSPRRARTLVADVDGKVVGAATLVWSSRHPDLVSATIDVEVAARRRGVGTALLTHLENEADRPLMFNLEATNESSGFLRSAGFDEAVTSVTSRLVVAEVLEFLGEPCPEADASSITLVAADELDRSLIELYERIYADRHRWTGRYTPPPDAPWIQFAGEVLKVPGAIQIATHDGELVAVATLHNGPFADGADAFVPPTSVLEGSYERRLKILVQLLRALLRAGLDAGVAEVNVEYDSTYDDLTSVMAPLPTAERTVRHAWLRR